MSKKVERLIADMALLAIVERVFKSPEFSKQTSANAAKRQAELNQPHNSEANYVQPVIGSDRCFNGHPVVQKCTDGKPWNCGMTGCEYNRKSNPTPSDEQGTFEDVLEGEFKTRLFPQALLAGTKKRLLTAHQSAVEAAYSRGCLETEEFYKDAIKAAEVALLEKLKQVAGQHDGIPGSDRYDAVINRINRSIDAELRSRTDG